MGQYGKIASQIDRVNQSGKDIVIMMDDNIDSLKDTLASSMITRYVRPIEDDLPNDGFTKILQHYVAKPHKIEKCLLHHKTDPNPIEVVFCYRYCVNTTSDYTVHCTLYTVHCTLHTTRTHYTLHTTH